MQDSYVIVDASVGVTTDTQGGVLSYTSAT